MNDVLSLSCIPHRLLNITFSYVIIRCIYYIYIVYDFTSELRFVRNCESALTGTQQLATSRDVYRYY